MSTKKIRGMLQPDKETVAQYVQRIAKESAKDKLYRQTQEHGHSWGELMWIQDYVEHRLKEGDALDRLASEQANEWFRTDLFVDILATIKQPIDLQPYRDLFTTNFIEHYKNRRPPATTKE